MLVPLKWLKDYIDIDIDSSELADRLTMSGSKVEAVTKLGHDISNVCVGKILSISKHPNADKLLICQIDVGREVVQIVTGAQNVREGDYIPVALSGAELPGNVKIKKGKLRGEESNGMLCSAKELNINEALLDEDQKDGIYILKGEPKLGEDIKKLLDLEGDIIEFEITSNRPDCLSVIGMARETSATLKKELRFPEIRITKEEGDINDYSRVEVENINLCPRYGARVVKDVVIKDSPYFIKDRLIQAGVRPINNIVDITNYVMLELGQPLHAFDLDRLEEKRIVVRNATEGEVITTLDEVERKLQPSDLVIADGKKAVAIAGVMGGFDSEIKDDTKVILLESANFNGDSVRKTSKRLGLRTEASSRFEKGIDPNIVTTALDRVCQLIEMTESGNIVGGAIDINNVRADKKLLPLDCRWINEYLGTSISLEDMIETFKSLSFEVAIGDRVEVIVPSHRIDIEIKEDLAEEIARVYGYENIVNTPLEGLTTFGGKTQFQRFEDRIKDIVVANGAFEVSTYSFVSPKIYKTLEMNKPDTVNIINPLGEDFSIMRTTIVANILEVVSRNFNRGVSSARFFELGNIYLPLEESLLPRENKRLVIAAYGEEDFFTLKGLLNSLFNQLKLNSIKYSSKDLPNYYHPGRSALVEVKGENIGSFGEVHPDVLENLDIEARVYVADLDIDKIYQLVDTTVAYKSLPKYPSMTRDIAVVVKEDVEVAQIEEVIKEFGSSLLEDISLFDVYKGKQIEEGYKSVAYNIVYRAKDRTLTDEEILKVQQKIIDNLETKIGAKLRY